MALTMLHSARMTWWLLLNCWRAAVECEAGPVLSCDREAGIGYGAVSQCSAGEVRRARAHSPTVLAIEVALSARLLQGEERVPDELQVTHPQ
eukprot:668253-Pyramimonas_sp.AAC.3